MTLARLLLASLLFLPALAWAQPDQEACREYLQAIDGADQQSLSIGGMNVTVTVIPDCFEYMVAKDFAALDLDGTEDVAAKVKRLAAKHKTKRKKTGLFIRFNREGGGRDVYAIEGKITKKIKIEAVGRGKAKFQVVKAKGQIATKQYTLFQAQSSTLYRGQNILPVVKRKYFIMGKEYALDLMLKKPLHAKTKKLKVKVSGFIHFSGNISGNQMDFSRGAQAEFLKGGEVSFRVPPFEPVELPKGLADLLK